MPQQQGDGGGRDPRHPPGRAECRGPGGGQLFPGLVGKAVDGPVVQTLGKTQRLVLAIGADIGRLPVEIGGVTGLYESCSAIPAGISASSGQAAASRAQSTSR